MILPGREPIAEEGSGQPKEGSGIDMGEIKEYVLIGGVIIAAAGLIILSGGTALGGSAALPIVFAAL